MRAVERKLVEVAKKSYAATYGTRKMTDVEALTSLVHDPRLRVERRGLAYTGLVA